MSNLVINSDIVTQLSSRSVSQNKNLINNKQEEEDVLIITSPSDIGVIRNGGRQGSCFAPKVILNELSKFQKHSHHLKKISTQQVTLKHQEEIDFKVAQNAQINTIKTIYLNHLNTPLIHLGGGHDHIFPLLSALDQSSEKKLNIINIDAHLDTRIDPEPHSGTPFRQFDKGALKQFKLHQVGIHQESNASENFNQLSNGKMIIHMKHLHLNSPVNLAKLLAEIIDPGPDWLNILSIDLDALDASEFKSCSAINPDGISFEALNSILSSYQNKISHPPIIGFYEYNPIYDCVSNKDAKKIAWSINQIFKLLI